MKTKLLRLACKVAPFATALFTTSCWVGLENPIEPDETVDDRLVGVWKIVELSPDEIEAPESPRFEAGLGIYEALLIGKAEDGSLTATGIDEFRNDGVSRIGDFNVRTRSHKGKHFLVGEIIPIADDSQVENRMLKKIVLEYSFNEDGDLFLWVMHDGMFDEEYGLPPLPHRVERHESGFQWISVTASADELLNFLVDPRVSPEMGFCGKYRKMLLPEGNSPAIEN